MSPQVLCILGSLFLFFGCSQEGSTADTPVELDPPLQAVDTSEAEPATKKQQAPAIPDAIAIEQDGIIAQIANWEQLQEFIGRQNGKIVVVDLWSTWCEPCLREFPHLVALQKKYPEKVVCVSFNLNYDGSKDSPPESSSDELMEFFTKQKAEIVNLISSTPDEDLYKKLNLAAIPAAYVYGTDGKLQKRFDNETLAYGQEGFNYKEHIVPFIDDLLQQPQKQTE
ncbi:TlpA family protein disulfide reductase [Gimesia algae]|uniref:Thiol-disulfide oxidoreductase n=1 Tax=Gimesia algae TaxID=2527971 RepID=A0A517VBB2_9PLAN|nr:TlpA disulfide reductase family protein [Gimesia algae]QDT90286.1 thiol-disulfide oxidoreductase [Gimesia algae]